MANRNNLQRQARRNGTKYAQKLAPEGLQIYGKRFIKALKRLGAIR